MAAFDAIAAALLADWKGMVVISAAILLLFGGSEVGARLFDLPTEWTRKATHFGSGAVVLAFPWLVSSSITIVILALSFLGILVAGRLTGWLGSIHNVERRTGGAYYYPIAVLLTWLLSGGEPLLFCVPLAVMAVADAGAALIGQRSGETTYPVMDGTRSVEGSMAFFTLAFAIALVGTALDGGAGWPGVLLVSLTVAGMTTAVEAVSVRGSDNIFIPYAAWMALDHTARLGLEAMGDWIAGMALGVVIVTTTTARARLTVAGGTVVFIAATLAWTLGGLAWSLPLASLYALYLLARPSGLDTQLDMVFPTTAASMIVLLAFAHTAESSLATAYLVTVCANGAIAVGEVARARSLPTAVGVLGAVVPALAAVPFHGALMPGLAVVFGVIGLGLFQLVARAPKVGRRTAVALGVGAAAWLVVP